MTIEMGPTQANSKPAATSDAAGANGKTGSRAKPAADAPAGFMAILTSLDDSSAALPVPADDGLTPSQMAASTQADTLPVTVDAAALLAQASQWSPVQTPADVAPGAGGTEGPALLAKPVRAVAALTSTPGLSVGVGEVAPELSPKGGKGQMNAALKQGQEAAALTNAAQITGQPDAKTVALAERVTDAQAAPLAMVRVQENAAMPLRREDSLLEKSIFKMSTPDGTPGPPATATGMTTSSGTGAPATVSPTDAYIAEQVSCWISNDVQNAEMKLDGMGDHPVAVSIRMHGNEAHIAFRTDEIQTREVLENASLHLKDMLQREGVILSGVSVGTSGSGDSGAQERKPRPGARQLSIGSVQPLSAGLRPVSSGPVGRALDLFV
jgi:flagellar hook-length control protein FliK